MRPLESAALEGVLEFLRAAERLKDVMRSAHTGSGRIESTAEHSWRLCLWATTLAHWLPEIDTEKLLRLCVMHDLGEALNGDVPATEQHRDPDKSAREARDLDTLTDMLPEPVRGELRALWREYEDASTAEARIAKGLDKLETLLQHTQGRNPPDFDYAFNLEYGRRYTEVDPRLAALRVPIDAMTRRLADTAALSARPDTTENRE